MTSPRLRRRAGYFDPTTGREKIPGVTSIIGMLAKPALIQWAADQAADEAVRMYNDDAAASALRSSWDDRARDQIRSAHTRTRDAAGDRGTSMHAIAEAIMHERPVDVTPELAPFVDSLRQWIRAERPEPIVTEATVYGGCGHPVRQLFYAGTLDLVARFKPGAVVDLVVDYKTHAARNPKYPAKVWPEQRLQLAAYRHADYEVGSDDKRREVGKLDGGLVVHLYPDGYEALRVAADDSDFEAFSNLRHLYEWHKSVSRNGGSR